jgi:hypothetical protein
MRYVKVWAPVLAATLSCCGGLAASASAEGGPLWTYCASGCAKGGSGSEVSSLTAASEALLLLSKELNAQELDVSASAYDVSCSGLEGNGYLSGGAPGTDRETITYSGCSLPNKTQCDVSTAGGALGTITTNALETELVYLTEAAAKGLSSAETGTRFKPASGTTLVTLELHPLTAGACPVSGSAALKGELVLENDEQQVFELSHSVLAPATAIKKYYSGMTGSENKVKALELAGVSTKYLGNTSEQVTELGGPGVAWWDCSSKGCIDQPAISVSPEDVDFEDLIVRDGQRGSVNFIFENKGPGEWFPGEGEVLDYKLPEGGEGAFLYGVTGTPCLWRRVPLFGKCATPVELVPEVVGFYLLEFNYAFSPAVTVSGEGA